MTLISIIGEFDTSLLNIINEFKERLDKVILVFDSSTASQKNMSHHTKMLEHFRQKYKLHFEIVCEHIIDEDNYLKIDAILEIAKQFSDVYFDISHSLGSTAAYIGSKIDNIDIKLLAFNAYENEYNLISKEGFSNHKMEYKLGVIDYLESFGYTVKLKKDIPWIDKHKENIYKIFSHYNDYMAIRKSLTLNGHPKNTLVPVFEELGLFNTDGNIKEKGYLEGGLFEDYIYLIIKELGFDDVLIGAEIIFSNNGIDGSLVNNEFDILAFKNNRLYLFECKFTQSFTFNDLVYKYMALKEYIKNDSKGIIITYNPKTNPNEKLLPEEPLSKLARKKALLFDVHIVKNILEKNRIKEELFKIIYPGFLHVNKVEQLPVLKKKQHVYFLGGYDLEMHEIKGMLEKYRAKFYDKQLKWGAKVSDYKEELLQLSADDIPVFIELERDMDMPMVHESIDHHGPLSYFPASLEQIAQRFNHTLTRFQTLVAINDKAHKIGMKRHGATSDEIKAIRYMDRQKQGVTQEDEVLAQKSIASIQYRNEIPYIYSLTPHFSTIVDLVDFKHYIIYNDTKCSVYSYKSKALRKLFHAYIEKNEAYYGGKEQMFFCLKDNILTKREITEFINKIIDKLIQKD
ncbi:MAG: hypothetical protein J0647_05525 [Campylobacteraceae bacterium]|nr:hypothetical protein [Campylobacteraceae bacterium]